MQYTVKRSVSPDGKIDSISVETTFETDGPDSQAVIDAITTSELYVEHVRATARTSGRASDGPTLFSNTSTGNGEEVTITGNIQAVYLGEKSQQTGKMGPGALIIEGTKLKSFKKDLIEHAKNCKERGIPVTAVYKHNEKWNSNDLVSLDGEKGAFQPRA